MKNWNINFILIALLSVIAIGCTDDKNDTRDLNLNLTGLENLGSEFVYEGWIIVNGSPVTTGTFSVKDNGDLSKSTFTINAEDLDNATTFVLTIEPSPDSDPAPSSVHVLAGDFSGDNASLNIQHESALGNDFKSAKGSYILATPTDGGMMDNEESGVWFLDPTGPSATLELPTLPAGWAYEGWAVINGTPVSTGTFTSANGADGSAIYSGNAGGPPFPGEDFLKNAPAGLSFPTSLAGGVIVISIEPVPDNSVAPFKLKPLVGEVGNNPAVHALKSMNNNIAATAIAGTASKS